MDPRRAVWFTVGFVALPLAALGAVLPTTVFLPVAAFAFARSSDRWHAWLLSHRVFGPLIADWRDRRAIDRRAKIFGAAPMAAVFGISLALGAGTLVLAVQAAVLPFRRGILSRGRPGGHEGGLGTGRSFAPATGPALPGTGRYPFFSQPRSPCCQ